MKTPDRASQIAKIRLKIDALDSVILKALARRRAAASRIIREKSVSGRPLRDLTREENLLGRVIKEGRLKGLSPAFVKRVYEEIIDDSVRLQEGRLPRSAKTNAARVAYQGIEGAYSELAAKRHFSDRREGLALIGKETFSQTLAAVEHGDADYAVLPVENTTAGSINEVYDLLGRSPVKVTAELILPVDHCLLALSRIPLSSVRRVLSHPQALAQCMRFLGSLQNCRAESFADTAMAVRKIREDNDIAQAAIASEEAGRRYGLTVLRRGVADRRDNFTRFVVVALQAEPIPARAKAKTSIMMTLPHKEGSLLSALNRLHEQHINLTKLESRPDPSSPFQYRFFVDLEGSLSEPRVAAALKKLKRETAFLKILGSYPACRRPGR